VNESGWLGRGCPPHEAADDADPVTNVAGGASLGSHLRMAPRSALNAQRLFVQGVATPMRFPSLRCLFGIVAAGCLASSTNAATPPAKSKAANREFRAGAALLDVTPELGSLIVGGFNPIPARHIHDPLYARALVLDDGAHRIAFVVCDNVAITREAIDAAKEIIERQSKLPGSRVMVSSTHTHSGPSARPETSIPSDKIPTAATAPVPLTPYQAFIARRIADAVHCAINNLEPAKIGWGSVSQPKHVFNRRWYVSDEALRHNPFGGIDRVRMNPPTASPALEKPAGPTDPEIPFISVQSKAGRPIGMLAAYSLHYVGGVPAADISADYYGMYNQRMRELVGAERQEPAFVSLMANGTSGNVNNIDFSRKRPSQKPYEHMREVAHEIADAVFAAYQKLEYRDSVTLDSRYQELTLGLRRPSAELVAKSRELLSNPARTPPWHGNERIYANRVLQLAQGPATVLAPLQAFRIGGIAIMTIPAETFVEIGLDLKARSPIKPAFAISIANGAYGYMPTPEQHKLGGYESWLGTNRLEEEASTKIVTALLAMVTEMKAKDAAR
jgi:neutral ceramidase